MARCPRCTRHFRVMEDEEGMHECPSCGYAPWNEPLCAWCDGPVGQYETEEYTPYCCELCMVQADVDSMEDSE